MGRGLIGMAAWLVASSWMASCGGDRALEGGEGRAAFAQGYSAASAREGVDCSAVTEGRGGRVLKVSCPGVESAVVAKMVQAACAEVEQVGFKRAVVVGIGGGSQSCRVSKGCSCEG